MNEQPNELDFAATAMLPVRKSRALGAFAFLAVLVVAAGAAAFLWFNYDRIAQTVAATQPSPAEPAKTVEETVTRKDFQAFQQQTAASLQSLDDSVAAQKADLQRLSEQVSALTAKFDAIQTVALTPPPLQAVSSRPPLPLGRKKPLAPKPGPISVGGAPLPSNPTDGH